MDKAWIKIISVTGSVGVIGLLFSLFMNDFFSADIINLLGSEKIFFILVLLICVFFIALIIAILKSKDATKGNAEESTKKETKKDIDITYDRSTHNGDNNF
jgi:uncharacterized membrane protein